ncbi:MULTISPECIES: acyl-CoA thioesterase [Kitasatospora]|uniref:Thioesterase family protein n=1 Tax=Kitasatospora cathayae TaxID=3004092 RepID=A0ABY7QBV8_9ACTN|nr:thioesterase family protein [Kitasatospora sp. HUAS 3-15]WBP90243.1 thioesterase family protein [Kitasatospora sp. HUAS 3-15]
MSALNPGVHVLSCPTRWSDVDENGHINNARLVGYIQEGIYDLFCHHATAVRESLFPSGFIIARHEIDYLEQLHHRPEPLSVRLTVERIGRSSAHVEVNVCREPLTFMRARTVVVARDRESGRSRKLSQNERRFLSAFMSDSVADRASDRASDTARGDTVVAVAQPMAPAQRAASRTGSGVGSSRGSRRRVRASAG